MLRMQRKQTKDEQNSKEVIEKIWKNRTKRKKRNEHPDIKIIEL